MGKFVKSIELPLVSGEARTAFAGKPTMEVADRILNVRMAQACRYDRHEAESKELMALGEEVSKADNTAQVEKLNRLVVEFMWEYVKAICGLDASEANDVAWDKVDILEAKEFVNSFRGVLGI